MTPILNLFIASKKDLAGMNIANQLIDKYCFRRTTELFFDNPVYAQKIHNKQTKLLFVDTDIVDTQFFDSLLHPELFIFLSRHSSTKGVPTLSVHTPGNLSEARFGGKPGEVSISPASAMKNALLEMSRLTKERELEFEVSYECTHHGPSLNSPTMFVELGSSPKQWNDIKAAEVVADSAVAALSGCSGYSVTLGIGGPHYNSKFTKLALQSNRAFGHMIPKYAMVGLDLEIIRQCAEKTLEKVDTVLLDWKGIKGEYKKKIIEAVNKIDLTYEKI
jgi:D-aminoacyl-tRNA deacylase